MPKSSTISNEEILKLLLNQSNKPRIDQLEDERKTEETAGNYALPALAAGLGAAGYGSYKLGDKFLTEQDLQKLQDFGNLASRKVNLDVKGKDLLYDYVDRASGAASVKPFGYEFTDFMRMIRGNPSMNKAGIIPQGFEWKTKVDPTGKLIDLGNKAQESSEHYTEFGKGPISGYKVLLKELVNRSNRGEDKYFEGQPFKPDEFYNKVETNMSDFLKSKGVLDNSSQLPHGQQTSLVRDFNNYLGKADPQFGEFKAHTDEVLGRGLEGPTDTYGQATGLAKKVLSDTPKALGIGAGAVGAGLGGYWLYNFIKNRQNKKTMQKQAKFNLGNILSYLTSGAGALAGGANAYNIAKSDPTFSFTNPASILETAAIPAAALGGATLLNPKGWHQIIKGLGTNPNEATKMLALQKGVGAAMTSAPHLTAALKNRAHAESINLQNVNQTSDLIGAQKDQAAASTAAANASLSNRDLFKGLGYGALGLGGAGLAYKMFKDHQDKQERNNKKKTREGLVRMKLNEPGSSSEFDPSVEFPVSVLPKSHYQKLLRRLSSSTRALPKTAI